MRSRPSPRNSHRHIILSVLVVVALAAVVGPAAADARITLTDATVTPATPTAGAPITAETTLRLSAGSDTAMTVDEVRVVDPSEGTVLGTASDLGRLSPGETLDVPVTFTVNESGTHDLRLIAVGTDTDGDQVEATRPLTVGVERGEPTVEITTDSLVAGADSTVQATVSNPTTAPLRAVEVGVADGGSRVTIPTLAAGATETVNLTAQMSRAGDATLALTTNYTTPNGARLQSVARQPVTVESLRTDIGIRTQQPQRDDGGQQAGALTGLIGGGGGGDALQSQSDDGDAAGGSRVDVTVTNFGNTPVEDVVLTAESDDGARLGSVGRFAVAETLAPGEETTVTVDLAQVRATDGIRFVTRYNTPQGPTESALTYGYSAPEGEAALTGLDVSVAEDGRVTVDGNLANTGDGEVRSAVVTVRPTEGVEPAYPQRNYFVGTVDASSFAPFQLTAQADTENASQLSVQVRYAVDSGQATRNATVPLPPAQSGSGGGPVPSWLAATLLVGLVAAAGTTVYVTRYR